MKKRSFLVTALAAMTLSGAASHAATLEQKWVAGQKLSYDVSLTDGHLTLMSTGANMPLMMPGIPLTIDLSGEGNVDVETREVSPDGTGIVALRVPKMQLDGSMMGFKATMKADNGKARLLMNGKEMGDAQDVSFLTTPAYALRIDKAGGVQGLVKLDDLSTQNAESLEKAKKRMPFPIDFEAVMKNAMSATLQPLWPTRDLKAGDTWSIAPKAATEGVAAPLGQLDLKLVGEENILGRAVQRVSVAGEMTLSRDALMNADALKNNNPLMEMLPRMGRMKQVVNGDLWFDSNAGQLVRARLKMHGQGEAEGTRRNAEGDDKNKKWSSSQEFEGTLRLELRDVSMLPVTAAPNAKTEQPLNAPPAEKPAP